MGEHVPKNIPMRDVLWCFACRPDTDVPCGEGVCPSFTPLFDGSGPDGSLSVYEGVCARKYAMTFFS